MAKKGKKHNSEKCFEIVQKVAVWGKGDKACDVVRYTHKSTFSWGKTPDKAYKKVQKYISLDTIETIIEKC